MMTHKLPRQMENPEVGKNIKYALQALDVGVKSSMTTTLVTNFVIAGSVSLLWSFINSLQMVLYLPLS